MHNLKVENYALFNGHSANFKPRTQHLRSLWLLQRGQAGSQDMQELYNKDQVVGTSKDDCWLKKTRCLRLSNLALFYVWEDTGVWAPWNHSFDGKPQLSEASILLFSILNPLGVHSPAAVAEVLMATTSIVYWYGGWHFPFPTFCNNNVRSYWWPISSVKMIKEDNLGGTNFNTQGAGTLLLQGFREPQKGVEDLTLL